VISQFENVTLKGGSEEGSDSDLINTHNELLIGRLQLGNDEKLLFSNNHLKVAITELYQQDLKLLTTDRQSHQQAENAVAALINHGFIFSLSKFYSETPWGDVNGHINFTLNKGVVLSDLLKNPYLLLDYATGEAKFSFPKEFLNVPSIGNYFYFGLKNNLLKLVAQKFIFAGSYRQGQLIVNGHEIVL
jgi:hypothetical protein